MVWEVKSRDSSLAFVVRVRTDPPQVFCGEDTEARVAVSRLGPLRNPRAEQRNLNGRKSY